MPDPSQGAVSPKVRGLESRASSHFHHDWRLRPETSSNCFEDGPPGFSGDGKSFRDHGRSRLRPSRRTSVAGRSVRPPWRVKRVPRPRAILPRRTSGHGSVTDDSPLLTDPAPTVQAVRDAGTFYTSSPINRTSSTGHCRALRRSVPVNALKTLRQRPHRDPRSGLGRDDRRSSDRPATPWAKEPVRMKPRKQLGVTRYLLRRKGLWVIDGRSPTGTARLELPQVGRLRWSRPMSSPATRGTGTGRSAGSAFEPDRSRGTPGPPRRGRVP